jgi:hypothetical protein
VSGATLNLIPVNQGVAPTEGSKSAAFSVLWSNTKPFGTFNMNLLQQYQSGQFTVVQSVFIDNSTCPYQVTVSNQQTQQTLRIPPFTQGMYPIISGANPSYVATLNSVVDNPSGMSFSDITTSFFFLNTPQQPYQITLPNYGANFLVANGVLISPAMNTLSEIVPPGGSNVHYIINAIYLQIVLSEIAATEFMIIASLQEMGTSTSGGASSATSYQRQSIGIPILSGVPGNTQQYLINIPSLTFNANNGLGLLFEESNGADASFNVAYQLNYGSVILQ